MSDCTDIKIVSVEVVRLDTGPDKVYLITELPDPWTNGEKLHLKFECPRNQAEVIEVQLYFNRRVDRVFPPCDETPTRVKFARSTNEGD